MSKTKSITDLGQELQDENKSLKGLSKLANQYTKMEFGYSVKELHDIIQTYHIYMRKLKEREEAQQRNLQLNRARNGAPNQ